MEKIKVAFILSGLGHVKRGAEFVFLNLMKRLVKKSDLEIHAYGGGKNFHLEGVEYHQVPCIKRDYLKWLPHIKRLHLTHNHDWEGLSYSVPLSLMLLRKDFDIISSHSFPFDLLPIKVYRKFKNKDLKTVFTSGGGSAFLHSRFFESDRLIAQTPEKQDLFSRKYPTSFIPCGVDTDLFRSQNFSRKDFNLPEDKLIVFSASALDPVKRLDFLMKAMNKIENSFLLLAGDGPQKEELEKLGKKLLGDNVRFLGSIGQDKLVKYYNLSDVFCLPSKSEPFGIVLIEAMACQKPVVTNDTDTQKWIIKQGGACVNVSDLNTLVKALEQYKDKELASNTGLRGRENVLNRFSWDASADEYCKVFKELIND